MASHRLLSLVVRALLLGRHRLVLNNLTMGQKSAAELHGKPIRGGLHNRYQRAG